MTLDVVGSTPTIYPLKINTQNLLFLKEVNFKKIIYMVDSDHTLLNIFNDKMLHHNNIKLLYYYYYLNDSKILNINSTQNHYFIALNKKKNHYYLSIIENDRLYAYLSVGVMLQFFNFNKKCLRRSKKGFNVFMNCFKKFFSTLIYAHTNLSLNFIDFNFIMFKKKFFKGVKIHDLFFLKFNTPYNAFTYKKYKNIRKRLKKKFLKRYTL